MVVHDKGLCRAMRKAFKAGGYQVAGIHVEGGGTGIAICTGHWAVQMERKNMPKEILSQIVMHTGTIPEPGEAMFVRKKDVQTMIYAEAIEPINEMVRLVLEQTEIPAIKYTGMTWKDLEIWQRPGDGTMELMDPEIIDIGLGLIFTGGLWVGDGLYLPGTTSNVFLARAKIDSDETEKLLSILSKGKWVAE